MTDATTPETDIDVPAAADTTPQASNAPVPAQAEQEENDYVAAAHAADAALRVRAAKADTPKKKATFFGDILRRIAEGGNGPQLAKAALQHDVSNDALPMRMEGHAVIHGVSIASSVAVLDDDWENATPKERLRMLAEALHTQADHIVQKVESVALHRHELPTPPPAPEAVSEPQETQALMSALPQS